MNYEQLKKSVQVFRPELLPLLAENHHSLLHFNWNVENVTDALDLCYTLHGMSLLCPEIISNSAIYKSRYLIQRYIKLKYLETFPAKDIHEYSKTSYIAAKEVQVMKWMSTGGKTNVEKCILLAELDGRKIDIKNMFFQEIVYYTTRAFPFSTPTECLLTFGSDHRSLLNCETKKNKYCVSTIPLHDIISRSSCTCSNTSMKRFSICDKIRRRLLALSLSSVKGKEDSALTEYRRMTKLLRTRIANCLCITNIIESGDADIILTPSGSDAELISTAATMAHWFSVNDKPTFGNIPVNITSIISACGEVGSGSSMASGGKHFSKFTPSGNQYSSGEYLSGISSEMINVVELQARDSHGSYHSIENQLVDLCQELLGEGNNTNVVQIHLVVGSKTGLVCPSLDTIDELLLKFPNRIVIVVDACQLRISAETLRKFISRNFIVLFTGSKFYAGSPFCGGVILPKKNITELESSVLNYFSHRSYFSGFKDYFNQDFVPNSMPNFKSILASSEMNIGLLLRWETALHEMEMFLEIPESMKTYYLNKYVNEVKGILTKSPLFEVLTSHQDNCVIESIVSFKVRYPFDDRFMEYQELQKLHLLLSEDLSNHLNDKIYSKICHLGQPVKLGNSKQAVLRIALGADMMNKLCINQDIGETSIQPIDKANLEFYNMIKDDEFIVLKIDAIVQRWSKFSEYSSIQSLDQINICPSIQLNSSSNDSINLLRIQDQDISPVLTKMVASKLLHDPQFENVSGLNNEVKLAIVYDINVIENVFQNLLTSFPPHFHHRFAVKSCPLSFFLKIAIKNGIGLECASIVEVQHAMRLGCPTEQIVFDSPCKTMSEIKFSIDNKIDLNADNFEELELISSYIDQCSVTDFPESTPTFSMELPRIGVRINPLLGAGENSYLSVSTRQSKFGIPLTDKNRAKIVELFLGKPWLVALHCHVGSQGCSLQMLAKGGGIIEQLASDIDSLRADNKIQVLNIGGGLPTNYDSDTISPTFQEYAETLKLVSPKLFEYNNRVIFTEFGRSVCAKTGWIVSEVEYVKHTEETEANGALRTAIIHAGSDLLLRTCYKPELFKHRMSVYKSNGQISDASIVPHNVAGPLCFGGDLVGRNVLLPKVEKGDFIVIHDAGSNTMAMFSRHCSRLAPIVYGYYKDENELEFNVLKPAESAETVMKFWG